MIICTAAKIIQRRGTTNNLSMVWELKPIF